MHIFFPKLSNKQWASPQKSKGDLSAIFQKKLRELGISAKISSGGGGKGHIRNFSKNYVGNLRVYKEDEGGIPPKKIEESWASQEKKNKGPYLSNLPAKMRRAKKTEENWASQEKKFWGFISAIV